MIINKRKIFSLIPFAILSILLCYTWIIIFITAYSAVFSHYLGILLFLPLIYFFIKDKSLKKLLIFTGVYLVFGIIDILLFVPSMIYSSFGFSLGSIKIWTPGINPYAVIIFIVYAILNFDTLTDIYLDYREAKGKL